MRVEEIKNLKEELLYAEAELALRYGLPHLHGYPWYPWALEFFEATNKMSFLCAANQISKSSTQIRKAVHWATEPKLWPHLWPNYPQPNQFWYLYPTSKQCTTEFHTKWKEFLPRGEFKNHPQYGWKEELKNKEIHAIHFKTGVSIYFKSYKQGLAALQTGSVFAAFLDEECPAHLWDELVFRTSATNGYLSMVFTATLGQDLWRQCMEPQDEEQEKFPGAWKKQISMYDCQRYIDGTPSRWTDARINQVIATCRSPQEVQRRVYGRFVKDDGLKVPTFDLARHMKPYHPVPKDWLFYSAVDMGNGGEMGHPAAIVFIAVRPDYQQGRVVRVWRGDKIRTTAGDVLIKYKELRAELKVTVTMQVYDWASVEFGEIAKRNGEPFVKADKSHERGDQVVNTLFKNDMLFIYEDGESGKLAGELCNLSEGGVKRHKSDDLYDALRYCVVKIPWDWSCITNVVLPDKEEYDPEKPKKEEKLSHIQMQINERRSHMFLGAQEELERIEDEIQEWQSYMEE